ncbi:MAG: serine/threonine-protein phosphatase [Planctomycetota bacterium]|nr:serine/threonine-protein phosphatase [Planctomycetota bacterium]
MHNADPVLIVLDSDMGNPQAVPVAGSRAAVFSGRCPVVFDDDPHNEDAALVVGRGDHAVLGVADGLGGVQDGEQASKITVETIVAAVQDGPHEHCLRDAIQRAVEVANETLLGLESGASTTLVVAEIYDRTVRPYHVGDSALLVVAADGTVKAETVPHSPVGYALAAGLLDEREAMYHQDRHLVSNVVGAPDMRVEIGRPIALEDGDTVLLATDGFLDNMHVSELAEIVRTGDPLAALERLVAVARTRMLEPVQGRPSKPDDHTAVLWRPAMPASDE